MAATTAETESLDSAMSRKRRPSNVHELQAGPHIRRMSRMEPRPSVQYNRRMSYASRSSISGSWAGMHMKPTTRLANTYHMAPKPEEKFNASTAERIMAGVMQSYLAGEKYDKFLCTNLAKNLADVIKDRMKDQSFSPRYKYVCLVTIGQKKDQGMAVSSRCVWNTDTDNYASATFSKGDLLAVATLYACYFE